MKCLIHELWNAASVDSIQNLSLSDIVATALLGLTWPEANGSHWNPCSWKGLLPETVNKEKTNMARGVIEWVGCKTNWGVALGWAQAPKLHPYMCYKELSGGTPGE